jgi:hypothetical protein
MLRQRWLCRHAWADLTWPSHTWKASNLFHTMPTVGCMRVAVALGVHTQIQQHSSGGGCLRQEGQGQKPNPQAVVLWVLSLIRPDRRQGMHGRPGHRNRPSAWQDMRSPFDLVDDQHLGLVTYNEVLVCLPKPGSWAKPLRHQGAVQWELVAAEGRRNAGRGSQAADSARKGNRMAQRALSGS